MNEDTPIKRCPKCERWLEATPTYFYTDSDKRSGKKWLRSICKPCYNKQTRATIHKKIPIKVVYPPGYVSARSLSLHLNISKHKVKVDIDSGVLSATNIGTEQKNSWAISPADAEEYRRLILANAGNPEQCGACGTKNSHIFGDVNADTQEKYGYLCAKCLKLVRDFQGDPKRIRNVLGYVERTRTTESV